MDIRMSKKGMSKSHFLHKMEIIDAPASSGLSAGILE